MTTPDHTLTDAELELLADLWVSGPFNVIAAVERIIATRLAAVEAVRDHYAVLAGLPVHAADVADRLDAALDGGDD